MARARIRDILRVPSRKPLKRSRFAVLPTLLTLGNGVCGLASITLATKTLPAGEAPLESTSLLLAGVMILMAAVFDMLDGHAARLTANTTDFGAELDSLCDAISFGAAPVFIIVKFSEWLPNRVLWAIGALFMMCSVLRLARFNVEKKLNAPSDQFAGLPTPAAAGTIAAFAIAMPSVYAWTESSTTRTKDFGDFLISATMFAMPFLAFTLSCLMVSRVPYPHVFKQVLRGRRTFFHLVQLIFAVVAVIAFHELALPLIFCFFALSSPIAQLWKRGLSRRPPEPQDSPPPIVPQSMN